MSETKNSIKAKFLLMINLSDQLKKIGDELYNSLTEYEEDDLADLLTNIQNKEITDIDSIMKFLEDNKYFKDAHITEDGDQVEAAHIEIRSPSNISVKIKSGNEALITYLDELDTGTYQVGNAYEAEDGTVVDLCFAEIKKGELAETAHLSSDNKDIDLYTYGNVYSEEYTNKETIKYEDLRKALDLDEEPVQE